jgi:hypothetical protein
VRCAAPLAYPARQAALYQKVAMMYRHLLRLPTASLIRLEPFSFQQTKSLMQARAAPPRSCRNVTPRRLALHPAARHLFWWLSTAFRHCLLPRHSQQVVADINYPDQYVAAVMEKTGGMPLYIEKASKAERDWEGERGGGEVVWSRRHSRRVLLSRHCLLSRHGTAKARLR